MTVEEVVPLDRNFDVSLIMRSYLGAFKTGNQTSDALIKYYGEEI